MSLLKETQQACKILLESEMVMKMLPLNCVDLTRNDPKHSITEVWCFHLYTHTFFPFMEEVMKNYEWRSRRKMHLSD
jgi:hypothetical protein